MTVDEARKKYDEIVRKNLRRKGEYKDPDCSYMEDVQVIHPFLNGEGDEISINLASDGVCGIKTIDKMLELYPDVYEESLGRDGLYKLLRKNRFDLLIWPSYATSINQLRYAVFKDRIDLTLLDIEKFYDVIGHEVRRGRNFSMGAYKKIEDACRLSKAYLNLHTFAWLCSFEDFSDFVVKRGLKDFVEYDGKKYHAAAWAGSDTRINSKDFKVYFERLVDVMGKMA